MEGSGVTNYGGKPTYAFSASTTEFDDALIQRGIVRHEDAIVAKGADREQARQLVEQHHAAQQRVDPVLTLDSDDSSVEEEDDDAYLDDDFMDRYRQQRIAELQDAQSKKKGAFGEVVVISRDEWRREVNEASEACWVVICLTASDAERTGLVERAVHQLASKHAGTKFVAIPSKSAIPNWPEDNMPSLFLYRHGKMQHQLVALPTELSVEELQQMLYKLDVLSA